MDLVFDHLFECWGEFYLQTKLNTSRIDPNHSVLQYSEDIFKFRASFWKRIVKKGDQKMILEYNFKNKNIDDF